MDVKCPQCGAAVNVIEGQTFLTCGYCSSAIYIDRSRVVFHYILKPTLDQSGADASLYRWMAGSRTIKGLEKEAQITGREFNYFPVWYFKIMNNDAEIIKIQPAMPTPIPDIKNMPIPAGDLRFYDRKDEADPAIKQPQVLYTSALEWLSSEGVNASGITQSALVHIPLYIFHYRYGDNNYSAVVDGSSSKVMAVEFPSKSELPYLLVGVGATVLFFIEGMSMDFPGLLGIYLITAIFVIIAATFVAEKV
jgi:DNA-directed RNA polymerase subunit RPC12/RpoP